MRTSTRSQKWTSAVSRDVFWVVALLGIAAATIAWGWYAFAQFEAQTEQGRALNAGTTMAGFAEFFGGGPLVLAHLLGLILLLVLGWTGWHLPGVALAVVAVLVASGLGVLIAQLVWQGELVELGIDNDTFIP